MADKIDFEELETEQMSVKKRGVVELTYAQIWAIILPVMAAMIMWWKSTDIRLTSVEIRISNQEQTNQANGSKLDRLQEGINDIRLTLRDKVDRNDAIKSKN
jgi:hypothetical protein